MLFFCRDYQALITSDAWSVIKKQATLNCASIKHIINANKYGNGLNMNCQLIESKLHQRHNLNKIVKGGQLLSKNLNDNIDAVVKAWNKIYDTALKKLRLSVNNMEISDVFCNGIKTCYSSNFTKTGIVAGTRC